MNKDKPADKHAQEIQEAEEWASKQQPNENTKRGNQHLKARIAEARKAAGNKKMISVRIDEDVIDTLKEMAGEDGSYQSLLNRALIEWCEAQRTVGLLQQHIERLEKLANQVESALKIKDENEAA